MKNTSSSLNPSPTAVLANLYNDILAITYYVACSAQRVLYFELLNQLHLAAGSTNQLLGMITDTPAGSYYGYPPRQLIHTQEDIYPQLARMIYTYNNYLGSLPVKTGAIEVLIRNEVYHHLIRSVEIIKNLHAQEN